MGWFKKKHIHHYHQDTSQIQQLSNQINTLTQQLLQQSSQTQQIQNLLSVEVQKNLVKDQQALELKKILEERNNKILELHKVFIDNQLKSGIIDPALLNQYKDHPDIAKFLDPKVFKVGLIGKVSSGKSFIINQWGSLTGAARAKTGHDETTVTPQMIKLPEDDSFAVFDFPGMGGVKFDYAQERQYIYLLSKMDVIVVVFDGVLDTSASQTITFVKHFPNKKLLLFNKIDEVCENLQMDLEIDEADALHRLDAEAQVIAQICAAETHFLVSAKNCWLNERKSRVHRDEYDWKDFEDCIDYIHTHVRKNPSVPLNLETFLSKRKKKFFLKNNVARSDNNNNRTCNNNNSLPLVVPTLRQLRPVVQAQKPAIVCRAESDILMDARKKLKGK